MEMVGVVGVGQTLSADDSALGFRKLNMMIKAWAAQGIHLWAVNEATLFLNVGQQSYTLGTAHCTDNYVQTTLSTDEATGSTSLGLTSTSGMSASDNIGIVLDSGTIHWTTISGAPGSPTTIADALPSAASAGSVVFAYTTKIGKPLRVLSAYRRDINGQDTPIEMIAREDYARLASKSTAGKPIQAFYLPQLTTGTLRIWPTADLSTDVVRFWYERTLEDSDVAGDDPDFPVECAEAIVTNLADRLAATYGLPMGERAALKADAALALDAMLSFDREDTSLMFQPDIR
jgi:hypothetical protein